MAEQPRRIEQAGGGLDQLKSLLFQGETRRLDDVERTVARLDQRVGDAPRLERATSEILVEAFRDAEVVRHRELADAVAPVVVAAIRNEIRNSREMMVEALYPLTGQLVVAAVQNAFRELVATINQRLEALTSTERWKLRIRSRLTGRPISELAMSRMQGGRIVRVFFLESGSGRLIERWRADGKEDERADMVGGLIAALTGFARDALEAGANELRTLDFGGRKTFLRSSAQTIIAAETEGNLTHDQVSALDRAFLALIEQRNSDGAVREDALRDFAAQIDAAGEAPARKSSGLPFKIVAALFVLLLTYYGARFGARWLQERQIANAVAQTVAQRPNLAAFPFNVATIHADRRIELSGVLPSNEDAAALADALKAHADGYEIASNIAIVAAASSVDALERRNGELERQLETARQRLDALGRSSASAAQVLEMQARLDAIASSGASATQVEDLRSRMEAVASAGAPASLVNDLLSRIDALAQTNRQIEALSAGLSQLKSDVAGAAARLNSPRAQLTALTDEFALFFSERERAIDNTAMLARLDDIAALLKAEPLAVRVIGHTDVTGSLSQNRSIARQRADVVVNLLLERGVDRKKIIAVSRTFEAPIAGDDPSTRERNRRVTLEVLHDYEATP